MDSRPHANCVLLRRLHEGGPLETKQRASWDSLCLKPTVLYAPESKILYFENAPRCEEASEMYRDILVY